MLAILNVVPSWVWAALVLCLGVLAGVERVQVANAEAKYAQEVAAFQTYQTAQEKAAKEAEIAKAAKEHDLQTQFDNERNDHETKYAALAADRDALLARLQSRPTRPTLPNSAVVQSAGDGQAARGCTGAELYREDASVVVGESERADKIRIALVGCYRDYDAARDKLMH